MLNAPTGRLSRSATSLSILFSISSIAALSFRTVRAAAASAVAQLQSGHNLLAFRVLFHNAVLEIYNLVRYRQNPLLMAYYDNVAVRDVMKVHENIYQTLEAPQINTCFRLIEKTELSAPRRRHGDLDSLHLSARKCIVNLAVYVISRTKTHSSQIRAVLVDVDILSRCNRQKIPDLEALESHRLLEREAHPEIRPLVYGHVSDIRTVENYPS